jgi:hypothetical protein
MIKAAVLQKALETDIKDAMNYHLGDPVTEELMAKMADEVAVVLDEFMVKNGLARILTLDMGDGRVEKKEIVGIQPYRDPNDLQGVQFKLKLRKVEV